MKDKPIIRWVVWHKDSFTAHIGPNEGAAWMSLKVARGLSKDAATKLGWRCTRITFGGEDG